MPPPFIQDDFLLATPLARRLYHEAAAPQLNFPIYFRSLLPVHAAFGGGPLEAKELRQLFD